MNICSIDISKAFDKTNHYGLLLKLMKRLTPSPLIDLLHYWLCNCWSCVKWNNCYSHFFKLTFGVRQGSVLSPVLFAVYLNDISVSKSCNHLFRIVLYADDLLLISPSVHELQQLYSSCEIELHKLDMAINVSKSCCLRIGPRFQNKCVNIMSHDGSSLPWVTKVRYLGVYLVSSFTFRCCLDHAKKSFFRCANAVMGKVGRAASEEVVLELIRSKCMPLLLYATEALCIPKHDLSSLDFVVNRFLMKLFRTNNIDTINDCVTFFGFTRPSSLINSRLSKFIVKYSALTNVICEILCKM